MGKYTLFHKTDDTHINVVFMDGTIWFFGRHHILLDGTPSTVLDTCSHRTFSTYEEYEDIIIRPLLKKGWQQLNT